MNRGPFIFIGVLIVVSLSWAITLVKPIAEAGHIAPMGVGSDRMPGTLSGLAQQGQETYRELGCVQCHTQQVRAFSGNDIERGWGDRQSMPIDYIDQSPVFTGTIRMGPDLSNVGARRPDLNWHLLHFYNPQITSPNSNMPPFAFLFETRRIVGEPSDRALDLPEGFRPAEGYEVVPTRKAEALSAYMLNLIPSDYQEAPNRERLDPFLVK